jgi:hypothetical protein
MNASGYRARVELDRFGAARRLDRAHPKPIDPEALVDAVTRLAQR